MSQFINTVKDVGRNYSKFDKWEQARADKMAQKEYLVKKGAVSEDKLELIQKKAQSVIRATEIMDTRSENNCENVEQVVGILAGLPAFGLIFAQNPIINFTKKYLNNHSKEIKNLKEILAKTTDTNTKREIQDKILKILNNNEIKANNIGLFGTMGLMFATAIGMILWGNSQQKQASRIGRFQAKQDELKDVENFIVYTPEQLKEAEEIAKTIPDKKERNSLSQAFHELKEMQRDRGAYKRWAKQKDPNELDKLKARNISSEELEKAKEDKELIANTVAEINIKAEEFSENLENAFDTFGTLSWLIAAPLGFGINKLLNLAKVSKKANMITSILVPTITSLGIQMAGTFEQKNASRIGRYHARQDLMNNPHKLMSFTESEMAEAQDIKASKQKKGFFEKIGDSFKFLKDYYKHKKEYKNYKENVQKYNEKMQEAFKQIETTDAQKAEAKALQINVFRAFDEVDEMSQRYSEDIEATTEIAKSTASNLWQLGWMGGVALLGAGIVKGRISLVKPVKWLTNLTFDANSTIRSSVNKIADNLLKSDKKVRIDFQQALLGGNKKLKPFLEKPQNAELKSAIDEFTAEIGKLGKDGLEKIVATENVKPATEIYKELFNKHLKQTKIAKWARNLLAEIAKLKVKSNAASMGVELPKEMQEQLGLNGLKNYKTLVWTGAIAGLPILVPLFAVPYMFNAWLTDIQKKAGKIGVMKAMNNLDDPRIFAHTNS
ncbi:hypothetical protein IJ384_01730 [bacterium]|nr:hypothetical protein [bacterium]